MTALHQIGRVETLLSNSPLSTSKLWWRDIETISGPELHAFLARMGYEGYGAEARADLTIAIDELRKAVHRGEANPVKMAQFSFPEARITTGEIRALLSKTTLPRRKAIMFAAEMEMGLKDMVELRWPVALKMKLTEQARWVLLGQPRHFRSNLVFWEYSRQGSPFPLIGFTEEVRGLLGNMRWEDFARQYRSAIPYDYDAEALAFGAAIN